ncbi:YqaJ viral recombinase family protein [Desulfovibrio sp. OttesenSCG-928-G15]|nr:YqaJ viral recombinase family protein [Desulfovibrio sp. OttesenSCG-928-G15]
MPNPGYLTPSTFKALMTPGKKEPFGGTALAVVNQLALDLAGVERPEEGNSGASCAWGIEHESDARCEYESKTLSTVRLAEFRSAPDLAYVGGTMDGLVGHVGGIEIKCPHNSIIHANADENLMVNYIYQVHGYMWIYGLQWIDFVSFDPRFPEGGQLRIIRVERDEAEISKLRNRCAEAYKMAVKIAEKIRNGNGQ